MLQAVGENRQCCAALLSRSPCASKEELAELAEMTLATFSISCDAGDPAALSAVLQWAHAHLPAVSAVGHAAGTLGYDTISDVGEDAFWAVCQPKVGARHCSNPMWLCSSCTAVCAPFHIV